MNAIVCNRCKRLVDNPYEQFSERVEYRRLDCRERRLSRTVRLVCRECVDAIRDELDHKAGAVQGSLFE